MCPITFFQSDWLPKSHLAERPGLEPKSNKIVVTLPQVSPSSIPSKVRASGRGLQPNGIRVNETVDFRVFTEGAGEGEVGVKIIGPGGVDVPMICKKIDDHITEYTYTPRKEGRHTILVTFAGKNSQTWG